MAKDNIRHLQDYYDEILKKYPDVTIDELDKLLKHAFRAFYMLNGYGADVKFKFNNCVMYVGHLFKDKVKRARYFFVKWGVKYRIMWRRKKRQWDGYYYIGVSDEQHKLIKSCKKRTTKKEITPVQGRPMILYKIPEECFRMTHWKYFYRTRFYKKEGRFTEYVDSFPIKELEYYAKRESESKPIEFVD